MVNSLTAQTVIKRFTELIARFGVARTITIGIAKRFSGVEFESYDKKLGNVHLSEVPFRPASNGRAERGVKIIVKQFLARSL